MVTYKEHYGYITDGEPTDEQIDLQDTVDSTIQIAVETIVMSYMGAADITKPDLSHDIYKITEIRSLIESLYGLPDVY